MVNIQIICGKFTIDHNLHVTYGNFMKKVINIKRFVRSISESYTFPLQHVFHNEIEMNEADELSDVQFERDPNLKVIVEASEDTVNLVKCDVEICIDKKMYCLSELTLKNVLCRLQVVPTRSILQ